MSSLEGKVALITGAGGGIGRASALDMAARGAAVMCADIDTQAAEGTVALVNEAGGQADSCAVDVSNAEEVQRAIEGTAQRFGGLNVLFNNAGVGGGYDWDQTIAINLTGVYHGLRIGAPFLAKHGGGAIINTSSIAGLVGLSASPLPPTLEELEEAEGGPGAYIAAKHGVAGLTKQFAINYGALGVRVNAISPGFIETAMTAEVRADVDIEQYLISQHPIGRLGRPEEIAAVASFLASEDASFVNGVVLPVDGGYTAR